MVHPDPAFPTLDRDHGWSVIRQGKIQMIAHGITDNIFCIVLIRYQKVWDHAMQPAAPGIIALVTRDTDLFGLASFMADDPETVIPENEIAFSAYGTKVFTAVR